MCGRYTLGSTPTEVKEYFNVENKIPLFDKSYNIAPGSHIPIITKNSPTKCLLARWQFVPSWAKMDIKLKPINARADKLDSGFYREAFKNYRCLIPADGFYEWKKYTLDKEELKKPYFIHLKNQEVFGFAGIYAIHKDAEEVDQYFCAIITTEPNGIMKPIHNRMPAIIQKKDHDKWLEERDKKLLDPIDFKLMEVWEVSKRINLPRFDDVGLISKI